MNSLKESSIKFQIDQIKDFIKQNGRLPKYSKERTLARWLTQYRNHDSELTQLVRKFSFQRKLWEYKLFIIQWILVNRRFPKHNQKTKGKYEYLMYDRLRQYLRPNDSSYDPEFSKIVIPLLEYVKGYQAETEDSLFVEVSSNEPN